MEQRVHARPRMESVSTQTSNEIPVVYATCQSVESIPTEIAFEFKPDNSLALERDTRSISQYLSSSGQSQKPEQGCQTLLPSAPPLRDLYTTLLSTEAEFPAPEPIYENIPAFRVLSPERFRPSVKTNTRPRPSSEVLLPGTLYPQAETITLLRPSSEYKMRTMSLRPAAAISKAESTKKLMKASSKGDLATCEEAIAHGADIEQRDSVGRTPLHLAVVSSQHLLVQLLLEAGAEKDRRDSLGRTPLHYTALRGRIDCARLLLDSGADPNARDSSGLTPTALAAMRRHTALAALFKKNGGHECSIS